ncbi:hypothetical protein [Mariniblastus fucicola]|uniref:Leucine Rich repeats (2 copies) n=1 Tax=Mariniblastus fucicola TaxID=980251 RepID=A0A5B9PGN5_9BACT|nr:hypothetical protein [Mariniblastus fucicola]QEG24420.1 hypothetical protein MFFC18_43390 [Mariniblastus fucicola]
MTTKNIAPQKFAPSQKFTSRSCSLFLLPLLLCGVGLGSIDFATACAQEQEESSRREAEAIRKIEAAGGRVMQISAADPTREVSFYLAGKSIADEHIKDLAAVENVVWLNLANTGVTNEGLKALTGLNLKKLHLEKTGIGDSGLAHLKGLKDLEYLNLYATSVTDEGLKHLYGLKKLKKVYVWKSKVTDAGMKALEGQIEGLNVVGESKLPVFEEPKKEQKKEPKKDAKEKQPVSKEEQLAAREKALAEKEKALQEKEKALQQREESLKQKEAKLGEKSDKKPDAKK